MICKTLKRTNIILIFTLLFLIIFPFITKADDFEETENCENNIELSYQELRATLGNLSFKITGNLPRNAYFTVSELDDSEYKNCKDSIDASTRYGFYYDVYKAYDITLYDEYDNEFQPQDYNEEVSITITDGDLSPYNDYSVFRIEEDEFFENSNNEEIATATEIEVEKQVGKTITFETDHFSVYPIAGKSYDTSRINSADNPHPSYETDGNGPYVVALVTYNGITWSIFNDGMCILTGDGSTQDGPSYNDHAIGGIDALCEDDALDREIARTINKFYVDCKLYQNSKYLFASTLYLRKDVTITFAFSSPNFSTSTVNNMTYMFNNNETTTLDLSQFDTHLVTNMQGMFNRCKNLSSLDLSSFDTHLVTDMRLMFDGCRNLESLNISKSETNPNIWNTSSVTNMCYMFDNCEKLEALDVSQFDTHLVTDMSYMFKNCNNLTSVDVSKKASNPNIWDTSKVTNMKFLFQNCQKIENLNLATFDTHAVESFESMFENCRACTSIIQNFDTSSCTTMCRMFSDCRKLELLDVSQFDTHLVTDMLLMFNNCYKLTTLDVSKKASNPNIWDTSSVTDTGMNGMFENCYELTSLDVSQFDTHLVTSLTSVFDNCKKLTSIDVSKKASNPNIWNTSKVTSMHAMFQYCEKLETIDVSQFDTHLVFSTSFMFRGCKKLKSLDVSKKEGGVWDTSKIQYMYFMFEGDYELETLNMNGFTLSGITNKNGTRGVFEDCHKLSSIDLIFDNPSLQDISNIFCDCHSIKELDLSTLDATSLLENTSYGSNTNSGGSSALTHCGAYIIKAPKKTGTIPIDMLFSGRTSDVASTYNDSCYCYYEEPTTGNPRFNNINRTEIPTNIDQGDNPTIKYYRKFKINYYDPDAVIGTDEPITSEYICPYDKYPTASNPEADKKISFLKSNGFTNAYDAYTIGDTGVPFDINTEFKNAPIKSNYILNLRGAEGNAFKVTLPSTLSLGTQTSTSFNKQFTSNIKVDIKSPNNGYYVSVTPTLTDGKITLTQNGGSHTTNMTVAMPTKKIKYGDISSDPDAEGYKHKDLSITFTGTINYPGTYSNNLQFIISSGTE